MKNEILSILKENSNNFVSGEYISERLSISRAAVWKHINTLKKDGYKVDGVSKNGYKLVSCPDILSSVEIESYLKTSFIGKNILYFDSIDSTNTYAKSLGDREGSDGTVILAEEQTKEEEDLEEILFHQNIKEYGCQ